MLPGGHDWPRRYDAACGLGSLLRARHGNARLHAGLSAGLCAGEAGNLTGTLRESLPMLLAGGHLRQRANGAGLAGLAWLAGLHGGLYGCGRAHALRHAHLHIQRLRGLLCLRRLPGLRHLARLGRLPVSCSGVTGRFAKVRARQHRVRSQLAARLKLCGAGHVQARIHIGNALLLLLRGGFLTRPQGGQGLLHFGRSNHKRRLGRGLARCRKRGLCRARASGHHLNLHGFAHILHRSNAVIHGRDGHSAAHGGVARPALTAVLPFGLTGRLPILRQYRGNLRHKARRGT